jgi:hypothetical protein
MIAPENPSQNQTLSLVDASDLSALTIEQAHSLMGRSGWLRFDSLMSLSSDVAAVLARHEGGLGFGMLNSFSEETEKSLSDHKGDLDIPFLKELKSRALATKLAGQPSWSEGQLLHISDAAAEGLVARAGLLRLNVTALHNLSPHARTLLEAHNRYGIAQTVCAFLTTTFVYSLIGIFIINVLQPSDVAALRTTPREDYVIHLLESFVFLFMGNCVALVPLSGSLPLTKVAFLFFCLLFVHHFTPVSSLVLVLVWAVVRSHTRYLLPWALRFPGYSGN